MRYYFNTSDGAARDDTGLEFASLPDARREAVRFAGELLLFHPELVSTDADLRVDISDELGLILFTLAVFGTMSPATSSYALR